MSLFKFIVLLIIFFGNISIVNSQIIKKQRDSLKVAIDLNDSLNKHKDVFPFAIPITEPAVGYGAVVGGLYFIRKTDPTHRPDMVAVFGGLTSNNTWLVGGAYIGYWKNDKIRYRGMSGYTEMNLEYYAFGESNPVDFSMDTFLFSQQLSFRIKKSDFFIGVKYQLTKITIPEIENEALQVDPFDLKLWNSGISLITEYDNLNNFLSPTKGFLVHISYDQNLEALGSDKNWGSFNFYTHMYLPINDKWVPAFRVDSQIATGDIPFYAKPYISLRGVAALRYQGEFTMLAETEQLYNIASRWGLLAFTGVGAAFESLENIKSDEIVWNIGAGFRYLLSKTYGLKTGLDIARGPEDWAFYITIGTSWLR